MKDKQLIKKLAEKYGIEIVCWIEGKDGKITKIERG